MFSFKEPEIQELFYIDYIRIWERIAIRTSRIKKQNLREKHLNPKEKRTSLKKQNHLKLQLPRVRPLLSVASATEILVISPLRPLQGGTSALKKCVFR